MIDRLAGFLLVKMGQIIFVTLQIMSQIIQRVGLAAVITKGSLDFLRQQALLAILSVLSFFECAE